MSEDQYRYRDNYLPIFAKKLHEMREIKIKQLKLELEGFRQGAEWQKQQMVGEIEELKEALKWALDRAYLTSKESRDMREEYYKKFGLD